MRCGVAPAPLRFSEWPRPGLLVLAGLAELLGAGGIEGGLKRAGGLVLLLRVILLRVIVGCFCPLAIVRGVTCQLNHFLVLLG